MTRAVLITVAALSPSGKAHAFTFLRTHRADPALIEKEFAEGLSAERGDGWTVASVVSEDVTEWVVNASHEIGQT